MFCLLSINKNGEKVFYTQRRMIDNSLAKSQMMK